MGAAISRLGFNWIFYTVIILFVGGIIILFMYICSLTASLKVETNSMTWIIFGIIRLITILSLFQLVYIELNFNMHYLGSLYSNFREIIILLITLYLVLGLIVAVGLAKKFEGPLKNKIRNE